MESLSRRAFLSRNRNTRTIKMFNFTLLFALFCTIGRLQLVSGHDIHHTLKGLSQGSFIETFDSEQLDKEEFAEFCELGMLERQGTQVNSDIKSAECSVTHPHEFDISVDGKMLFTLIIIITWGAIIRAVIHNFELKVPYTVVVMISGLIIGAFSNYYCSKLYEYTAIARISSDIILYTFLPLLIFESAFSIPVHTFSKSALQIILVAFPGMVFCTFIAALVCMQYFPEYKWNFLQASLFGSIISATDPVAVVAILRELGVSEVLSVMIEGESLLNDGVAILMFRIFEEFLVEDIKGEEMNSAGEIVLKVFLKFCQIAIGGPCFGWFMGRMTILFLSYVFNDPPVEISATIFTAYLTYWISEDVLGVSGVMAVVLLGLTMRAERTVISPDSEEAVHHFWTILGYLANTVLFMLVGIVITETALNDLERYDWWNLILLYISIHVSRFLMLLLLYPILARIGYGMTWQNMMIMMWGGLRGAVGICLALEVYRHEVFCSDKLMGSKMLFQTAGIVFITLILNGTTTRPLLTALKLTEISLGRKEDMNNAVKRVQLIKGQAIRMFKLSPSMFDADWNLVSGFCLIKNPYKDASAKNTAPEKPAETEPIHPPEPIRDNTTQCTNCMTLVPNTPTTIEYENLTEEARLKVIRAMKVSFTHRNGVGLMSDSALQVLMSASERAEDRKLDILHCKDLEKFTKNRGFYPWLDEKITKIEKERLTKPEKPSEGWRHPFYKIATHEWFERTMMVLVIINMIPVIWELAYSPECDSPYTIGIFYYSNTFFTGIFTLEFIVNLAGHTTREYFCDAWNYLDIGVLVISLTETIISALITCDKKGSVSSIRFVSFLRLLRLSRALRLLRPLLPKIQTKIHIKINRQLFVGFDIARGFVYSSEEVLKFLSQMVENKRVYKEIKDQMEKERAEGLKTMAEMQQKHAGIAIAVKTRHACRAVINAMSESLHEAKDEGLLDDTEVDVLVRILELKIKRLWHSPTSVDPYASQVLLANLTWLEHNEELYETILNTAELKSYGYGEYLCHFGDQTAGLYIIVAGMIKISYMPTPTLIELRNSSGKIPNSELYADLTFSEPESDYFSAGHVFGEYGVLTDDKWASDIVAETSLVVYFIPKSIIKIAMQKYRNAYDPLEGQMWRSVGIARASRLFAQLPQFLNATEKIQLFLERSSVPISNSLNVLEIPEYVAEVIIIEGYATNSSTKECYIAPFIVPKSCPKLLLTENTKTVNRLLIVVNENIDFEAIVESGNDSDLSLGSKSNPRMHSSHYN